MTTTRRLSIATLVFALALLFAPPAFADSSYVVQSGDNLTKIAARYGVTVDAIVQANHLKDANSIRIGQTLTIPDGSAQPAQTTSSGDSTYVVRSGDSLARLAARFNTTMDAITKANRLTTTTIYIGQTLIIPGAPAAVNSSVYDRISGSASFVATVKTALDWTQARDPAAYARENTYITQITPSLYADLATARPLFNGGCAVGALASQTISVDMIAALIYHEASHCYQFATAGVLDSKTAEVFAYSEQIAFMERNGFPQDEIDYYKLVLNYYASQPNDGRYIPPPNFASYIHGF